MTDHRGTDFPSELELGRAGGTRLTFGRPVTDRRSAWIQLPVAVEGHGFLARCQLDLEEWGGGAAGFVDYFDSLAADWRGWTGEKVWEDDQGNVRLVATHDGIGYAFIDVSLHRFPGRNHDEEWSINSTVAVDAGQLESATAKLRALIASVLKPT